MAATMAMAMAMAVTTATEMAVTTVMATEMAVTTAMDTVTAMVMVAVMLANSAAARRMEPPLRLKSSGGRSMVVHTITMDHVQDRRQHVLVA